MDKVKITKKMSSSIMFGTMEHEDTLFAEFNGDKHVIQKNYAESREEAYDMLVSAGWNEEDKNFKKETEIDVEEISVDEFNEAGYWGWSQISRKDGFLYIDSDGDLMARGE